MDAPTYKNIVSFLPPVRTLMGPGPSDVHPRILAAMGGGQPLVILTPSGHQDSHKNSSC